MNESEEEQWVWEDEHTVSNGRLIDIGCVLSGTRLSFSYIVSLVCFCVCFVSFVFPPLSAHTCHTLAGYGKNKAPE